MSKDDDEPVFFTPTKTFFSEELRSEYIKGMSYTATEAPLKKMVKAWEKDGSVVIGQPRSQIAGFGTVS